MVKRRGLQKRTADILKPLGFSPLSGTTFTRQVDEQLHFVGLQYRRFSSEITFNLGCHFKGIPSLFDYRLVTLDDLNDVDCGLRIRVGRYIGDGFYDIWWNPDNSELPAALAQASWAIERAFDDCKTKWGDGSHLIQAYVKIQGRSVRLSKALLRWMLPKRRFDRFAFVALLARHHGDDTVASVLAEKALSCDDGAPVDYTEFPKVLKAVKTKRRKGKVAQ